MRPCLNNAIEQYRIAPEQLGAIHQEITRLAGGRPLDATGSRIYILGNIDNAFALLDETFCCTPLLLDPETARQYRIDFMQVYIHENLHRLSLSGELLDMLQTLYDNDDFYRTHEDRARAYGEGGNEAFVVAAERYVSCRLGRIDDKQVLTNFSFIATARTYWRQSFTAICPTCGTESPSTAFSVGCSTAASGRAKSKANTAGL